MSERFDSNNIADQARFLSAGTDALRSGSDPVDSLRRAVRGHDDWPDQGTAAGVIDAARRLIRTIDQRAEMIDHMRRTVTPTQQAIQEVIGEH